LPLIRAGELRALAVTTAARIPQLANIPTIAESGFPGFDTSAWFALLAPKQTPAAVRTKLEEAAIAALTAADTRQQLATAGIDVAADGAAALQQRIEDETQMWRDVVATAGIKSD
jgi:tripartite-type tricarboxylate transporter receptor subunit TctC